MPTPRYIVQKVGEEYVTVPADSYPNATKATYVVWGSLLTVAGLKRRSLPGLAVAALGGWMAWTAWNGQKPSFSKLMSQLSNWKSELQGHGPSFQHDQRAKSTQKPQDEVEEASMESFPASDPPAERATVAKVS